GVLRAGRRPQRARRHRRGRPFVRRQGARGRRCDRGSARRLVQLTPLFVGCPALHQFDVTEIQRQASEPDSACKETSMRVLRKVCLTMGSLAFVALSALPARAADATAAPGSGEIAGGYSYVYNSNSSTGMPAGWFLSGGTTLGETFTIVGDISGNYKSQTVSF